VTLANLTFRPEVRVPFGGAGAENTQNLLTYAPRVMCEHTNKTTACGKGVEFGLLSQSATGRTSFKVRILGDWIDNKTRMSGQLSFEKQF
jgi:Cft2 family RNA processing exonuclease